MGRRMDIGMEILKTMPMMQRFEQPLAYKGELKL